MDQLGRIDRKVGDVLDAMSAQILTRAVRRSRRAGVADIRRHAGWGDPAEVIIETAQQFHVDAIVAGRRGRGRLAGLILGSVSLKVANLTPCLGVGTIPLERRSRVDRAL
jgi:nucleotide-binding universal stress UspA family protein